MFITLFACAFDTLSANFGKDQTKNNNTQNVYFACLTRFFLLNPVIIQLSGVHVFYTSVVSKAGSYTMENPGLALNRLKELFN